MQREGIFREMKLRRHYEKPSERRAREAAEAVRRARKMERKRRWNARASEPSLPAFSPAELPEPDERGPEEILPLAAIAGAGQEAGGSVASISSATA